jgi:hypothetical protein
MRAGIIERVARSKKRLKKNEWSGGGDKRAEIYRGPFMLASTGHRYFPRSPQDSAALRREAAFRAQVSELREAMDRLEKEQAIQFQRFAQIQQELDEIRRLLKKAMEAR